MTRFSVLFIAGCTALPGCKIPVEIQWLDTVDSAPAGRGVDLVVADIDADGDLDVVVARGLHSEGNISVIFGPLRSEGKPQAWTSRFTRHYLHVAVGDVSGDGKLDLLAVAAPSAGDDKPGGVDVFLGQGDRAFPTRPSYTVRNDKAIDLALVDVNLDGALDLALARAEAPKYREPVPQRVYLNQKVNDGWSLAAASYWESSLEVGGALALAVGDTNDDGRVDLVVGALTTRQPGAEANDRQPAWGVLLEPNADDRALNCARFQEPPGLVRDKWDHPHVLDLEIVSYGKERAIAVASANHFCGNKPCRDHAAPEIYTAGSNSNPNRVWPVQDARTAYQDRWWTSIDVVAAKGEHGPDIVFSYLTARYAGGQELEGPGGFVLLRGGQRTDFRAPLGEHLYPYAMVTTDLRSGPSGASSASEVTNHGCPQTITLPARTTHAPSVFASGERVPTVTAETPWPPNSPVISWAPGNPTVTMYGCEPGEKLEVSMKSHGLDDVVFTSYEQAPRDVGVISLSPRRTR